MFQQVISHKLIKMGQKMQQSALNCNMSRLILCLMSSIQAADYQHIIVVTSKVQSSTCQCVYIRNTNLVCDWLLYDINEETKTLPSSMAGIPCTIHDGEDLNKSNKDIINQLHKPEFMTMFSSCNSGLLNAVKSTLLQFLL